MEVLKGWTRGQMGMLIEMILKKEGSVRELFIFCSII